MATARATGSAELAATGPAARSAELAATGPATRAAADAGVAAARRCSGGRSNGAGAATATGAVGRFPTDSRRATDGHAGLGSAQPGATAAGSACARYAAPGCGVEPERLGARCRVQ